MGKTVFVFKSPCSTEETIKMLTDVVAEIGIVKKSDETQGILETKLNCFPWGNRKTEFYIKRDSKNSNVRAIVHSSTNMGDEWFQAKRQGIDRNWDGFLQKLFQGYSGLDFGVTFSDNIYVAVAQNLSGDTQQIYSSRQTDGTSLAGFLLGGFVFGAPGAIVGGLSGNSRTRGRNETVFNKWVLVRAILSNGRVTQGNVRVI
jgi:hypothetical protein